MEKRVKSEKQRIILRSEKRILLLGVGTIKNPIKPVPEDTPRLLLKEYSTTPVNEKTELHKLKEDFIRSVYILNVISNPHLTKDECRIAFYLFHKLWSANKLFLTNDPDKYFVAEETYGEDDLLHVGRLDSGRHEEFLLDQEVIFLSKELEKINIAYNSSKIVAALKRLHDFGYITITEINLANTYAGQKIHNRGKSRARLRHIRLSEEMQKKDISNRWLKKNTKHTKPKKMNPI